MRTLIFLSIGLLMFTGWLVIKLLDARKRRQPGVREVPAPSDPAPEDSNLSQRLDEAAMTFGAAGHSVGAERGALKTAITELSEQCAALSAREKTGAAFRRPARAGIVRLILALYGVVERATKIADRPASDAADTLLDDATKLIGSATTALAGFAERADDTALTHLEADLDVLRDRLDVIG